MLERRRKSSRPAFEHALLRPRLPVLNPFHAAQHNSSLLQLDKTPIKKDKSTQLSQRFNVTNVIGDIKSIGRLEQTFCWVTSAFEKGREAACGFSKAMGFMHTLDRAPADGSCLLPGSIDRASILPPTLDVT